MFIGKQNWFRLAASLLTLTERCTGSDDPVTLPLNSTGQDIKDLRMQLIFICCNN